MSMESDNNTIEANCSFLNEDQIKKAFQETFKNIVKERSNVGDNNPNWKLTTIILNVVPPSKREKLGEMSEWHGLFYGWINNPLVKQMLLGISENGEKKIEIKDPNWIPPKVPENVEEWIKENPEPEMEEVDEKTEAINAIKRRQDWNFVSKQEEEYEEELKLWKKSLEDYKNQYSPKMITIELEPFPIVPAQYTESQYTQAVNFWKNTILSKYTNFDCNFFDHFANNLLSQFDENDTIENNKLRYDTLLDDLQVFYTENDFDISLDPKLLPPFSSVYMKAANVFKKFPPNPNRYNNAPVVDSSMLISKPAELWITSKILYPLISQFSSDKEMDKNGKLKFPIITEVQINDKKLGPRKIFTIKFSNKQLYKLNATYFRIMARKLKVTNPNTKETTILLLNWKYENSYSENNSVRSGTSRGSGGNQKYQNQPTTMPLQVKNEQIELKLPPRGWNIPPMIPEKKSNLSQEGLKRGASPQIQRAQSPQKDRTIEESEWQLPKNKKLQQKKR